MNLDWKGKGLKEKAFWENKTIIEIDKKYFRPSEVQSLLGDSSKAKEKLGWIPEISIDELVEEMMDSDIKNEF